MAELLLYLPPAGGEGVAEVDGGDWLDKKGDQEVGKGDIRQQKIACLCLGKISSFQAGETYLCPYVQDLKRQYHQIFKPWFFIMQLLKKYLVFSI